MAALPTPIQPEPPPVPGDDRFRFEDEESRSPATPELREPSPEDAIGDAKLYSVGTVRALKNQKLMAEARISAWSAARFLRPSQSEYNKAKMIADMSCANVAGSSAKFNRLN